MNQFRICNRCRKTNIETLKVRLKRLDPTAEIIVGCQNLCGIGSSKAFAIVNHLPIIADNEAELVNKIKEKIEQ